MTASIAALREIMLDDTISLCDRMEAAEDLLTFEAPADATEEAKAFLTQVFEDSENHVNTRLDALKIIRKAEARKITHPPVSAASEGERREEWRKHIWFKRRSKLLDAGFDPLPAGWDDDLGEDFVPPDGDPPRFNPIGLAERMREARLAYYATLPKPESKDD
jgi:hypothetical protein